MSKSFLMFAIASGPPVDWIWSPQTLRIHLTDKAMCRHFSPVRPCFPLYFQVWIEKNQCLQFATHIHAIYGAKCTSKCIVNEMYLCMHDLHMQSFSHACTTLVLTSATLLAHLQHHLQTFPYTCNIQYLFRKNSWQYVWTFIKIQWNNNIWVNHFTDHCILLFCANVLG